MILQALRRGKVTPAKALLHPHKAAKDVKRIFEQVHEKDERYELNLYVVGYEDDDEEAQLVKVAYWPGCVSRGFTPELHGSMAKVAPLLDIELVELDRAACCGAGVHRRAQPGARRHPERAHLRARPAGRRRRPDDEHLLDLPGRAERVPGAARRQQRVPRARQPDAGEREPALREGHRQQALPVADGRGDRARRRALEGRAAADRPARRARSTAATSCARPTAWGSTASTRATATCTS